MSTTAPTRAEAARRDVLLAEYRSQQRALAERERDLAVVASPGRSRALRQSVAWHRESLQRLSRRLAA